MPLENKRMQKGQRLVYIGFGIAIIGIIFYCTASFLAGFDQDAPRFIGESLGVIGIGVLVWLVGAVKYLNGAIDSDTSDEDML